MCLPRTGERLALLTAEGHGWSEGWAVNTGHRPMGTGTGTCSTSEQIELPAEFVTILIATRRSQISLRTIRIAESRQRGRLGLSLF